MEMNEKKVAKSYALRMISRYPRTLHEISTRLAQKGYKKEIINEVIKELKDEDYLNDREYFKQWLATRLGNKPCGRLLCYKKLMEKGLEAELIKEMLDILYPREKELDLAREIAVQKREHGKYKKADNIEEKVAFHLKNKGFASDVIYEVLNID